VAARFPQAERRKMFGYPALFVGGNLVTSLFAAHWTVRLPDDARAELLAFPGASDFEVMPGRTMRGYAVLPPDVVADDRRPDASRGARSCRSSSRPSRSRSSAA